MAIHSTTTMQSRNYPGQLRRIKERYSVGKRLSQGIIYNVCPKVVCNLKIYRQQ